MAAAAASINTALMAAAAVVMKNVGKNKNTSQLTFSPLAAKIGQLISRVIRHTSIIDPPRYLDVYLSGWLGREPVVPVGRHVTTEAVTNVLVTSENSTPFLLGGIFHLMTFAKDLVFKCV